MKDWTVIRVKPDEGVKNDDTTDHKKRIVWPSDAPEDKVVHSDSKKG